MTILGNEGGSGGQGDQSGSSASGGGSGAGGNAGAANSSQGGGSSQASWRDSLPDDIKNDPSLTAFQDLGSFAKSYIHTKSMVGKKGVIVPGEKSTDEEWDTFYKSVGRPDLDKYQIEIPKEKKVDEKMFGDFKEVAHKVGLLPRQAKGVVEWWIQKNEEAMNESAKAAQVQQTQELESLKKEWGAGFDKEVTFAKAAVRELGGPDLQAYLETSGLGNNVKLIKAMAAAGKLLSEDKLRGEGGRLGGQTPAEIQSEIDNVMGNPKHPYFDRSHPGHANAVKQMESLYQKMYT